MNQRSDGGPVGQCGLPERSVPQTNMRENTVLGGRVRIWQPLDGYRVAIDPVLLAAAVDPAEGAHVLDAGAGTGAALLCLGTRRPDLRITGLELDAWHAGLCQMSIEANGLEARCQVFCADLGHPPPEIPKAGYDAVMTNPPFADGGTPPEEARRARAHMEGADMPLTVWVARCLELLRPKGRLTVIHRADRLDALLRALSGQAGEVTLFPLWPRDGVAAERVIVAARKGVRGGTRLLPGLTLHGKGNDFASAAESVLRDAGALDLEPRGRR
ncbi:tRNA1(Val) (adenine(37)-N6)-methyltransferase [Rhodospirillum sp. A1_3_36]|uniref:tRNA1(Val) (adenine(37)-N6)-methyltransferase n=1 Tax=Rhodospirillum sp. A1_3_36 TaxID=3391666 RepID=UPI0039A43E13